MVFVLAVALLAAEPTPLKLAAPNVTVTNLDPKLGDFAAEHIAQQLKLSGLEVVTTKEIATLLGLERQKQLLGCAVDNCVAELANALGVDGVLLGDIARVGSKVQVNLKIIGASSGKTLAVFAETSPNEDGLIEALTRGAQSLAVSANLATGRRPPQRASGGPKVGAFVVLGAGALVAGAGAAALIVSENNFNALKTGTPGANAATIKNDGVMLGTLGVVGLAVGGAAVATGVVLLLLPSSPVAVAAVPSRDGVVFAAGGRFP